MALGKMLKLGGIDNRPPKANQTLGKFRVARNVYPTPDGRLIPRYDNEEIAGQVSTIKCVHNIAQYGNDILSLVSEDDGFSGAKYAFYKNNTKIPSGWGSVITPFEFINFDFPQAVQSYRKNNTTYFLTPYTGSTFKYDGVEISPLGCYQPVIGSDSYNAGAGKNVRAIQHTLDFDNNEPWSEYVQFYASAYTFFAGTTILNSALVTLSSTTSAISPGMAVYGSGVPENTFVEFVLSSTQITLTNPVSVAGSFGVFVNTEKTVTMRLDGACDNLIGKVDVSPTSIIPRGVTQDSYFKNGYTTYSSIDQTYTVSQTASRLGLASGGTSTLTCPAGVTNIKPNMVFTSDIIYTGTANGTDVITAMSSVAGITLGMELVDCAGVTLYPPGTTVTQLISSTSIRLSNPVPFTGVTNFCFPITNLDETYFVVSTTSPNTVTLNKPVPAGTFTYWLTFPLDTNILPGYMDKIGSYVFVLGTSTDIQTAGISTYTGQYLGAAMKIVSLSPLKLDANDVYLLNANREWVTQFRGSSAIANAISYGTKTFISFWESAVPTGVYYYRSLSPSFPSSSLPYYNYLVLNGKSLASINSTSTLFNIGPILNNIYDVTSKKLSPNSIINFGGTFPFICSTIYQDQLILATDDLIWVSDTTLGGSFEQLNSSIFLRVGDWEYGRITSICGTSDFLIVCRERKNYYVNGTLSTANYRVQEITGAELGAWSNNASILIKDSVFFISASGVFKISDGGNCVKLSETCPKNFSTYDNNNVNEDVVFELKGITASPSASDLDSNTWEDNGISVAYDEFREILVFMKKGEGNPCFVLDTRSNEFYEWDGIYQDSNKTLNCISFIYSDYYVGTITSDGTYGSKILKENKTIPLNYPSTYPIKLYTSWMTGGEPSLEKLLLQLKIFGRIQSDGTSSSIEVAHYKDWDYSNKITNSPYFPNNTALSLDDQKQYSHKKRLNSDKVLAASVGFEVNSSDVTFEIEAIEVEFNPIQEGIKK
jgi:hypothetical protein